MKTLVSILLVLLPLTSHTQNKILGREVFEFSNKGLEPTSVTVAIDSLTKVELYDKVITWVEVANRTISDSDIKLISSEPNQQITIRGKLPFYLCEMTKALKFRCFNTKYTVDIIVFEGGYRITPSSLKYEANNNTLWMTIKLNKRSNTIYKSNGDVRPSFIYFPSTIETIFNVIDISLYHYIKTNEELTIEMF